MRVARVVRAGLTPLKGARHATRETIELDADGAVGDRVFCLVDPVGRRVLKTVQHPTLVAVRAHWDGSSLDVTLPSGAGVAGIPTATGESVTCDYWGRQVELGLQEGPHAALLSSYLGCPVRLAAAPRGGVIYGSSVSIVTTASLRALAAGVGRDPAGLDPARFRATFVLAAGDTPFLEDEWLGRELRLGNARVRVGDPIPRCAVVDLDPGTGERDVPLLKALGSLRPAAGPTRLGFGLDASVTVPGVVRPGDPVSLT